MADPDMKLIDLHCLICAAHVFLSCNTHLHRVYRYRFPKENTLVLLASDQFAPILEWSPNQFDCIHCPAKAPDPEKRYQVEEKMRWAKERLTYYEQEDLVLEAEKMKQLLRASELEIREMEQIVAYRKDEHRAIQIQPRTKRT